MHTTHTQPKAMGSALATHPSSPGGSIDRPTLLRLAAEADADPRSIIRELAAFRGERAHVKGRAGERVRAVLVAHGLIPRRGDV